MSLTAAIYRPGLALLTDLYQITMAYAYWRTGTARREAVFHLTFRENPFGGEYAVGCGLASVLDVLANFRFETADIEYLATLRGGDEKPLFEAGFLEELGRLRLECDVHAVPEGTVVLAHEPLLRVQGPILHAQILETILLNLVGFPTLVATKAARICRAAGGDPVLEFGLRRAQGIDGGLTASRAAYVGGCAATSNVLAGRLFGIPVRGTHAHSWVMSFDEELEAFDAYARAMPNNCVYLVDTYDTLDGVRRAIEVGRRMRERGHEMGGIRLDSGDLGPLSVAARRLLDDAGFTRAVIVASNDLDEHSITKLKQGGAAIGVWGVGTRLATAYDQPALGAVYKSAAVREPGGPWRHTIKRSDQPVKSSNPGILQVRRFRGPAGFLCDAIYDELSGIDQPCTLVDPSNAGDRRTVPDATAYEDLLVPVFRGGRVVYSSPPLDEVRRHVQSQLSGLSADTKRLAAATPYPVGLEWRLFDLKSRMLQDAGRHGKAHASLDPGRYPE